MVSQNPGPMELDKRPIGVFDSGIGGLTVLRDLLRDFPNENFIYLGDTARLPYGSKSAETVRHYSVQNMKYLVSQDVKALVVACNTASTQIFESHYEQRRVYNVIDPGSKLAAQKTENKKVGVLATRATIKSGCYAQKIKSHDESIEVFSQSCPLFVPLAEEGWYEDPITNLIAFRYLQNLKAADIDTVVLGCTHYPLLKLAIARVFGNHVQLIDSGEAVSMQNKQDFDNQKMARNSDKNESNLLIALTDKSEHFEALASKLLKDVTAATIQFETVSVI